jgi:signal transduction histidine kinase
MPFSQNHNSTAYRLFLGSGWLGMLVLTSYISYELRNFTHSLLLYLPAALSIVMVHWYGYRILPVIYINAIITLFIWKSPGDLTHILLVATHEPVVAFASKFLTDLFRGKNAREKMSSSNLFVKFVGFGFVIPIGLNSIYTYHYTFVGGDLEKVALLYLSDFITIFSLSLPLLFFFVPSGNWLAIRRGDLFSQHANARSQFEFWLVVTTFLILSFFVPFQQYWFIYGIVAVIIAVRHGFEAVLLINLVIFTVNYLLPLVEQSTAIVTSSGSTQLINVHLGNATMIFISTLVGRVVSDLWKIEVNLVSQKKELEKANQQLNQTNQELDRFVYSVSHDLSAPLKSIQGLIHLSRMDAGPQSSAGYLDMMEKSANRLNEFIGEVLDYSRTTRKEIIKTPVNLTHLVNELMEKMSLDENGQKPPITVDLQVIALHTDETLLKIALGNLLSNALKFQKRYPDHLPRVHIQSKLVGSQLQISITDNGEGIQEIYLDKIFEMFYRATSNSPGSGLGLYIARESVAKLGGKITVQSTYGEGSTFTILLPAR